MVKLQISKKSSSCYFHLTSDIKKDISLIISADQDQYVQNNLKLLKYRNDHIEVASIPPGQVSYTISQTHFRPLNLLLPALIIFQ